MVGARAEGFEELPQGLGGAGEGGRGAVLAALLAAAGAGQQGGGALPGILAGGFFAE